jgi:hypothetical protein
VADQGTKVVTDISGTTGKVKDQIKDAVQKNGEAVGAYVSNYNIFEKEGGEIGYDVLEGLDASDADAASVNALIAQANDLLKSTAKVVMALRVETEFLVIAKADQAALSAPKDPAKIAGIGLVGISAVASALTIIREATTLQPQLKTTLDALKEKASSKPTLGFKLSKAVSQTGTALKNLAGAASDAPTLLSGARDVLVASTK